MEVIILAILGFGVYIFFGSSPSRFSYRKKNGFWQAYFNGPPPSQSHVLRDGYGYYVCWDRPLRTEQEARQVARRWMDTYG